MIKKKTLILIALLVCFCNVLSACTKSSTAEKQWDTVGTANDEAKVAAEQTHFTVTADSEGNIVIPADRITTSATFYNYDADSVTVQLVAIRDTRGEAHISFNTCQSCSPSPKAYFFQQGDVLQCANCGFTFEPDEVGVTHGGCNPWPIDGVVIAEDSITVSASVLDDMRDKFASWQGPLS